MQAPVLMWFKRDLRVADHPALGFAAAQGPVIPLYIVEPEYWRQPDVSGRQFAFLKESVRDLARQLEQIGLALCLRVGEANEVLEAIRLESGANQLVSHEETGNQWTFDRDKRVGDWARGQGGPWHELTQSGVVRRLESRDGWAARRNQFLRLPQVDVPAVPSGPGFGVTVDPDFVRQAKPVLPI